jgi:hypothetical protein
MKLICTLLPLFGVIFAFTCLGVFSWIPEIMVGRVLGEISNVDGKCKSFIFDIPFVLVFIPLLVAFGLGEMVRVCNR